MILKSAQSLVETVIAAGLIAIGIVAAMALSTRSESQTSYAKQLAEANRYAIQAQDFFRTTRTYNGWNAIASKISSDATSNITTYCLPTVSGDPTTFFTLTPASCTSIDVIPTTRFTRQITIDSSRYDQGILSLTISVSWPDKTTRTTILEMELTRWQ